MENKKRLPIGSVNLITRPRRFGKSLNLDMLRSFFEIGTDPPLFAGLEIAGERKLGGKIECRIRRRLCGYPD